MLATYRISAGAGLDAAAEVLAIEQSLGTRYAGGQVVATHGARVAEVAESAGAAGAAGTAVIAFPVANLASIPALLVAVAGEAFETLSFDALQLCSLEFPDVWLDSYSGPRVGIEGIRSILGVPRRPLLIAILKPSIGLSAGEAAELAGALARGGADIVKDDELNSTIDGHDAVERARAVSEALACVEAETLRPAAYAVNITGPIDCLASKADTLADLGNVWPMVASEAIGLDALRAFAYSATRPILCHRAYCGGLVRADSFEHAGVFGVDASVVAGLTRIAGGDMVHCGGIGGKLFDTGAGVMASMSSCLDGLGEMKAALPIIGGGYWAGSVGAVRRRVGHDDFAFVLGSGITDHPGGPEAGMRSVAIALDAEIRGEGLDAVSEVPEVAQAIERFGPAWGEIAADD